METADGRSCAPVSLHRTQAFGLWRRAAMEGGPTAERCAAFAEALHPNLYEWDAVEFEQTPAATWAATWAAALPPKTNLIHDAATAAPIWSIR